MVRNGGGGISLAFPDILQRYLEVQQKMPSPRRQIIAIQVKGLTIVDDEIRYPRDTSQFNFSTYIGSGKWQYLTHGFVETKSGIIDEDKTFLEFRSVRPEFVVTDTLPESYGLVIYGIINP
jgi:hypothetical protein